MAAPLYQRIKLVSSVNTPRVSAISYGRTSLKTASDFNTSGLANNDVIIYNAANQTFEARNPDILSANLSIAGASDCDFPSFANGYLMIYNANTNNFVGESPSVFTQNIQINLDAGFF
jgi:hypothetical protein